MYGNDFTNIKWKRFIIVLLQNRSIDLIENRMLWYLFGKLKWSFNTKWPISISIPGKQRVFFQLHICAPQSCPLTSFCILVFLYVVKTYCSNWLINKADLAYNPVENKTGWESQMDIYREKEGTVQRTPDSFGGSKTCRKWGNKSWIMWQITDKKYGLI